MKLLSSNFNKSFQSLQKKVPTLFTRLQKMTSEVWKNVVKGGQKAPLTENFESHTKVTHRKNIEGSEVDFDRIRREFDSYVLRKAMENNESVFFEDDFVCTSDWASSAVKEQESFNALIIPIIKEFDDIEEFLTRKIQAELLEVNEKVNAVEEKTDQSILLERQSHRDDLLHLQKEKKEELENRLNLLEQGFREKEKEISNFESLGRQFADQFIKDIVPAKAGFQEEKIAKRAEKMVKKNKKFVSLVVKESSQRLNQEFKIQISKLHEEINAKFEEKEKIINQNLKEKLQSNQENLLKEKQLLSDLSAKKVKSLESEIQRQREKLINQLQNPRAQIRGSQQVDLSSETWEEMESVLPKSSISKEKTEIQEETSEDLFGEFPPNWFNKFQENIKSLEQEESNIDSKESLDFTLRELEAGDILLAQINSRKASQELDLSPQSILPKREAEMKPKSSSNFLQNLDNHPSVIEAKKLMRNLEKDYERRMTEICQLGENRLQAFAKAKKQKILNIEESLQHNLKIAQEVAARPREKAEQKLSTILQTKENSKPLQSLFARCQESIARYQLKKAKDREFRIIDAAFEKNHLLRGEGILQIKKETEVLEQQVLQQTEVQRKRELSRFRKLQNKIDDIIQTLQTSPWVEEISIL